MKSWVWYWGSDPSIKGPGAWSWFHLLWLFICILSSFFVIYFLARKKNKNYDLLIARISATVLLVLEIIKIIFFCCYYGYFRTEYCSFCLCSLPMYALLICCCFYKNNKIKDSCMRFVAIIGFIGGVSVMIMPQTTLNTEFVYYSIHTMLWHTILIVVSLYYFISLKWEDLSIKNLLIPFSLLLIFTFVAILINEIGYKYYINTPIGKERHDVLNYFFIAQHFDTSYPLLDIIKPNVPFPIFILLFIIFIFMITAAVYYLRIYIEKLIIYFKKKKYDK